LTHGKNKRFIYSSERLHRCWSPRNLLFMGTGFSFPGIKATER